MNKLLITTGTLLGVGALAVGALALARVRTPAAAANAAAGSGATIAGQQRRWAITLETRLRQPAVPAAGRDATTVLTGDWVVTVSGASTMRTDVACQLERARLTGNGFGEVAGRDVEQLERRLGQRFWITYQPDGAAIELHFPRDMKDDVRNFLELVVTQTQLVRPTQAAPQWTATERDGAGAAFVAYEQVRGEIIKRKLRYVTLDGTAARGGPPVGVRIDASESRFVLTADGLLDELRGHETTTVDTKMGGPGLGIDIGIRLEAARAGRAPELVGSLERARTELESGPIVTQRASEEELLARHDSRVIEGVTLPVLLETLAGGHADDNTRAALEALVRRRPAEIPEAVAFVRAGGGNARILLQALGAAGTEAAQAALCGLALDVRLPSAGRVDAIGALVQTKRPIPSTISSLVRLMDDADRSVRREAVYMVGAVGNNCHDYDSAGASRIEAELLARYARCDGPTCVDLLAALGNLASAGVVAPIARALGDASADLRGAAVRALRRVKDPAADRLISTTMSGDPAPSVRAAAVFAATYRPIGGFVEPLSRTAEADPVDYVRSDAIRAIAGHVNESPTIERALLAAATKDPKPGLRRMARQALNSRAADLEGP